MAGFKSHSDSKVHHIHGLRLGAYEMDYGMDHGHFWELSENPECLICFIYVAECRYHQSLFIIILP